MRVIDVEKSWNIKVSRNQDKVRTGIGRSENVRSDSIWNGFYWFLKKKINGCSSCERIKNSVIEIEEIESIHNVAAKTDIQTLIEVNDNSIKKQWLIKSFSMPPKTKLASGCLKGQLNILEIYTHTTNITTRMKDNENRQVVKNTIRNKVR